MPPAGYAARPTTDFAKEGLFNTLVNEIDFEEMAMLDLFSGTGSISYEAASRGCRDIVSVEMNPANARFIKQTAASLGIKGMQVVHHNVFDFLNICTKKFDFVFADPPYALPQLSELPDRVFGSKLLKPEGLFVLEHGRNNDFKEHPFFLEQRTYGSVNFSFFKRREIQP